MPMKLLFDGTIGLELAEAREDFARQLVGLMAKDEWLAEQMLALLRHREKQLTLELKKAL